jgi:crotonobetainyl-CoA:carnitine CoA-transferase CaiB-like acyl-CoA transferase
MPGPLQGVKVLDLSAVVAGPLTGALLADQGADVIKVERLGSGDIQRHVGSSRNGFSGFFHMLNRGKQSIALDLAKPEAIEIVQQLAAQTDVVIQNFRPGVVDRLGIGYEQLKTHNSGLIYLSIAGFGPDGPEASKRAYDPIIQTYSGIAQVQGLKRGEGPEQVNQLIMDKLTAHHGCQAICAALYFRSQSNKGQHINLSMLDTAVSFLWPDAGADNILLGDGIDHRPAIGGSGQLMEYQDGWGAIMILSDSEFEGMCQAFELPHLTEDTRFNTISARMNHRLEYQDVMATAVSDAAAKLTLAEAEQRLTDCGVPFARMRQLSDLPDDPQAIHNHLFQTIDHPHGGKLRETRPAPRFSESPAAPAGFAPVVGEHSEAVLAQIGRSDELAQLVKQGIIGVANPG